MVLPCFAVSSWLMLVVSAGMEVVELVLDSEVLESVVFAPQDVKYSASATNGKIIDFITAN
jgi:hypothetical protein